MNKPSKLGALFMALMLVFFGIQGILTGEVPAFTGRDGSMPSATFASPLVPWIGLVLVLVGLYVLIFFVWKKKK